MRFPPSSSFRLRPVIASPAPSRRRRASARAAAAFRDRLVQKTSGLLDCREALALAASRRSQRTGDHLLARRKKRCAEAGQGERTMVRIAGWVFFSLVVGWSAEPYPLLCRPRCLQADMLRQADQSKLVQKPFKRVDLVPTRLSPSSLYCGAALRPPCPEMVFGGSIDCSCAAGDAPAKPLSNLPHSWFGPSGFCIPCAHNDLFYAMRIDRFPQGMLHHGAGSR